MSDHIAYVERECAYFATCSCGWEGLARESSDDAASDCDKHEAEHAAEVAS